MTCKPLTPTSTPWVTAPATPCPVKAPPLPPTAQVARQQARYVIELLPKVLDSPHAYAGKGFAYRDFGALVSLANSRRLRLAG